MTTRAMSVFDAVVRASRDADRVAQLNARYRAGQIHAHARGAHEGEGAIEDCRASYRLGLHAALDAASRSFYSARRVIPPNRWDALRGRRPRRRPALRFSTWARSTQAFGENELAVVEAIRSGCRSRPTRTEYQTALSPASAELNRIALPGTLRHFVPSSAARRSRTRSVGAASTRWDRDGRGGFIVSFEGAFHGARSQPAVTHRKKARLGFPTSTGRTSVSGRRSRSLAKRRRKSGPEALWDLGVRRRHAEKSKDTYRRDGRADEFSQPTPDIQAVHAPSRRSGEPDPTSWCGPAASPRSCRAGAGRRRRALTSARSCASCALTRIYDVPLVSTRQTGWDDRPPVGPRAVRSAVSTRRRHWAKAQNGSSS